VALVYGAVTNAGSVGWTEQLQPVNSAELSVFTKTAAGGGDVLTVTNNGSNYPEVVVLYEFPAGSTYDVGTSGSPTSDTFPTLSGLAGGAGNERLIIAARGRAVVNTGALSSSAAWTTFIEDADLYTAFATTDGVYMTVAHVINYTGTSITPAATQTWNPSDSTWAVTDRQHVVFAINAVSPSSTTPFTKDYTVNWRVLNGFTKDVTVNWRVLAALTKDVTVNWRVLAAFTKDTTVNWRVLNGFTKDTTVSWRVLAGFTKDTTISWRVLAAFTKDVTLVWDVLAGAAWNRDYGFLWNVRNDFTKDYSVSWRVLAAWQKDYALAWRVLAALQTDVDVRWRVLGAWQRDTALAWRVLALWSVDADLRWRVLAGFARDYALVWSVLADTAWSKDYALAWNVRAAFVSDVILLWRVLSDTIPPPLLADVVAYLDTEIVATLEEWHIISHPGPPIRP
jgi:hypothetical protein